MTAGSVLAATAKVVVILKAAAGKAIQGMEMSMNDLRRRSRELLAEVDRLRKLPVKRKELRYQTPVSA